MSTTDQNFLDFLENPSLDKPNTLEILYDKEHSEEFEVKGLCSKLPCTELEED